MNKNKIKKNLLNADFKDNEDQPVIEFLNSFDNTNSYSFLEIGSGLCRFIDKITETYPNLDITCIEVNHNLAEVARAKGYKTLNENILKNSIGAESFDIIHCSHVIEHFKYPEVSNVIDEILRIVKTNGCCIIRSPLMSDFFYNDLDHVRPYPPEAISNYLTNEQQQKKGTHKIQIKNIWYRTSPKNIKTIDRSSLFFGLWFARKFLNKRILWFNNKLELYWKKYRFPCSKPNGYVMIFKKIN